MILANEKFLPLKKKKMQISRVDGLTNVGKMLKELIAVSRLWPAWFSLGLLSEGEEIVKNGQFLLLSFPFPTASASFMIEGGSWGWWKVWFKE